MSLVKTLFFSKVSLLAPRFVDMSRPYHNRARTVSSEKDYVSDSSLAQPSSSPSSHYSPGSTSKLTKNPLLSSLTLKSSGVSPIGSGETHARSSSLHSVVVNPGFGLLGGNETGLVSPGAVWSSILEKVGPLFQGRGLKGSIDELNELVR